jgi:sugar-specific transcriptional regulator TrmB
MNKNLLFDQTTVKNSLELLSVLSRRDNLAIFMSASAEKGLNADLSTSEHLGIAKKTYYTRLKQLIIAGLVRKSEGSYIHTTLGSIVYQRQIELMDQIRNIKHFRMIDALKSSKEFTDEDIKIFVGKLLSDNISSVHGSNNNTHVDIIWKYDEMVSAIVQRIELCRDEILLASKYTNELIINSMLHKVRAGIKAKVISDKFLVRKFFEQFQENMTEIKDKNTLERRNVVGNPWYPGNIDRRAADLPFSMIILDRKEVGIELIHANDPKTFNGVIFVRDENIANIMISYYQKIWESSTSQQDLLYMASEASTSNRYIAPSPA